MRDVESVDDRSSDERYNELRSCECPEMRDTGVRRLVGFTVQLFTVHVSALVSRNLPSLPSTPIYASVKEYSFSA